MDIKEIEKMNVDNLVKEIEKYDFECQGGYLKNCIHWIVLKKKIVKK